MTARAGTEEITQEAFARVFAQIREGEGPTVAFRAYLARTARNVAIDMARRGGAHTAGDDIDDLAGSRPDHSDAVMDNVALRSAFASLPTRWQEVLWYRDVEDLPVKECARFVGMSENATTALIKRAREGLKQAWIVANIDAGLAGSDECTWVVERLPRYVREKSTTLDDARIRRHLAGCESCTRIAEESHAIHRSLALVLLPFLLVGGAGTYLHWIRSRENRSLPLAQGARGGAAAVPRGMSGGTTAGAHNAAVLRGPRGTRVWPWGLGTLTAAATAGLVILLLQPLAGAQPAVSDEGDAAPRSSRDLPELHVVVPEAPAPAAVPDVPDASPAPGPIFRSNAAPAAPSAPSPAQPPTVSPEPSADRPAADPAVIQPVSLPSAAGLERGVYPRLVGSATSGATLTLTVTDGTGRVVTDVVTADASGTWEYTLHTVEGTATLTASQTYVTSSGVVVDAAAATEVYEVGPYLSLELVADGPDRTMVIVHGLPGSVERPYRLFYRSDIPELNGSFGYLRSGGNRFLVFLPLAGITSPIEYWQGEGQTSKVQVWTPGALRP